ncbi:MAG: thiamine pyrophosphate-dependent dehydrogenase E1 component subunit alpha [Spirochaetales bacterium]|nr:thiamine pyrophosphate-dependent dehydrogenase E1 component subunit alpha [Spirochaetales bacterium]MCF7937469.1 thiamine pyrophosphate-dependent dehydrogenase E1 component subunit alpha [Spirochaetales bacterium]
MLRKMQLIRSFEEKVAWFFSRGMVHGTTHLYIGEEATAVGATAALRDDDYITSTHRGHGHCIGKGIELNRMMAEFLGKSDGYCKGKGGSMHIADVRSGNLGANGVVGGGIPIAVGAGLTSKMKKQDRVVLCFFGDGANNQGSFHESLNLASVWKLPVVFLLENNTYAMSLNVAKSTAVSDLTERARAYSMDAHQMDGNNVMEVYHTVREAVEQARENGPVFLVSHTYRIMGHSKSDANRYRTREEIEAWKAKDPIPRFEQYLIEEHDFSREDVDAVGENARNAIEEAVAYAEQSPFPSIESIEEDVYA